MSLRRFAAATPAGERCEMCARPVGAGHGHVANLKERRILCTCRPCTLLFTHAGAGGPMRHFRTVPERYRHHPDFAISDRDWDDLAIPVRMAFFFHNSALGRTVACYPGPGGATEAEPPPAAWDRVLAANPAVADVEPDVEALLVDRGAGAYLVPIDACYELTGLVRLHWKGFQGGEDAWREIDGFFARLRDRAGPRAGASV